MGNADIWARFKRWTQVGFFGEGMLNCIVACLTSLLLAIIWTATFRRIAEEKRLVTESALTNSRNIASIAAANLEQTLAHAQFYAKLGTALLTGDGITASYLNPLLSGDSAYLRVAVFSPRGDLFYSSANRRQEPELHAAVGALLAQRTGKRDALIVGRAHGGSGRPWRVPLIIPLSEGDHLLGYFAATLDLGYFLGLYRSIDWGKGERLEIFDQQGQQLAETLGGKPGSGTDFSGSSYLRFLQQPADSGIIDAPRPGNAVADIGAYRKLSAYPLTVAVSRDRHTILEQIAASRRLYIAQAGGLSGLVIGVAFGLTLLARRQQRLYDALATSEQDKRLLIRDLEQEKVRAYELASHDFLTGIPNRMLFHDIARAEFARARRSRKLYALFFMDLDKFKVINDTLGHAVGDRLLQEVAQRLRTQLREYDLLARLGGDEFVMLISEVATEEAVAEIAAKLVKTISAPFLGLHEHEIQVSPSIGIALYPRDGQSVEIMLKHADLAMYSAKSAGRGAYRFFDASLNDSTARQLELLSRFRSALRDNEFCLHYQPRVELDNFGLVGLEALIRWQHPEHGLIYPNEFIGLAEQHGLIVPLGNWAINEACRQLAAWRAQGLPLAPIAVNVSARQLTDHELVDVVVDALARHQLSAELLEIEVTESCFIEHADLAREILIALRAHGIRIAMDDYGTGFSGLSSLKSLPIYAVKIDRSFVRDIRNDVSDAVIVASTITLAHNLGLTVVAEGVESREQVVHLKTAGCDQVQGFYFQRPVAPKDIEPILQARVFRPEKSAPAPASAEAETAVAVRYA